MATVNLSPIFNGWQGFNAGGLPLAGGQLFTYAAGTSTPLATYTTNAGNVANTNPIVLGADGRPPQEIWLIQGQAYKFILQDFLGNMIGGAYDNIIGNNDNTSLLGNLADTSSTSDGARLIGVNNGDTGEIGRTLHYWIKSSRRQLTNFLSTAEVDDILSNTGSIDVSTKFQTAINAAAGGILELPQGYIRADNLSVAGAFTTIAGVGRGSRIIAPTAANNIFTVSDQFIEIRDLMLINSVVRTGAGQYVDLAAGANRFRLHNFYFDGFKGAIRSAAVATVTIERGELLNGVAGTGIGVRLNAGLDVSIRDVLMDAAAQTFAGIYIINCGDVTIEDCNIIHAGSALYLNPGAGNVVTSVWANDTFFDTSARGLLAQAAAGSIRKCVFDQCWFGSHTNEGVLLQTSGGGSINGMYFNGCEVYFNGIDGISVGDTGCTNVHVLGGSIAQNTGSGFVVAANVTDFSVIAARIGDADGLSGNNVGINIPAGTSNNYRLIGNDLRGNVTTAIIEGGSGTTKCVTENFGFITRNGGADNVAIGTSAKIIAHGLSGTPSAGDINIVPTQSMVASGINAFWISTIGASNFTVNTDVNVAGAAFSFGWNASIKGS